MNYKENENIGRRINKKLTSPQKIVGKIIKDEDIVVYESTVYPGVTNSICVPLIEKISKLKNKINFKLL